MTAAHEVSTEREPINIAEKRQQYFDICEYQFNISFFRKDISKCLSETYRYESGVANNHKDPNNCFLTGITAFPRDKEITGLSFASNFS